ncbi:MAG: cysteine rich repeat-containing protein [Hyphomicrobium sp.]|uniref:cysteine rich repeat-containing protein n=1 Tax=Hyphomicrobium sp. TaxID=82 RepID=UPI0039E4305C
MKFAIAVAAALTLGSVAVLADETAAPPAGGKGACKADVQKFCSGVEHAKGKIRACLSEHQADLSDPCKQRVAAWAAKQAAPAAN